MRVLYSLVSPVTFNVEEALTAPARLEVPVTDREPIVAPVALKLVVEAFPIVPAVNESPVPEIPVVEA